MQSRDVCKQNIYTVTLQYMSKTSETCKISIIPKRDWKELHGCMFACMYAQNCLKCSLQECLGGTGQRYVQTAQVPGTAVY